MALFKQDPRYVNIKHYEDFDFSKITTRDSNMDDVEFVIDDNGPTVFAVRKPSFWQTTYIQKYILPPVFGSLGILSGAAYFKNPFTEEQNLWRQMCLGASVTFSSFALFSYFTAGAFDYANQIANKRMNLFLKRSVDNWNDQGVSLCDYVSAGERRDFLFDLTIEQLLEEGFATDLDEALSDNALNQHFHKAIKILLEDYSYISRERDGHLKELKLERLTKQWETFQLAIRRHPHTPAEYVIHSSLDDLSSMRLNGLTKILDNLVSSRKEIIKIKQEAVPES